MLELRFATEADQDFRRLYAFIAELNPGAADRLGIALQDRMELLCASPDIGRPYAGSEDIRESVLPFASTAYIIRYQLRSDCLLIVRIWNGREERS